MFVEVGPQAVLTGLAAQTLAGQPHLAVASDVKSRPGLVQLAHLLGQLLAAGVPANLDRLFQGRGVQPLDLAKLGPDTGKPKPPPTAWVVNGVRSRPINGPEPRLLGPGAAGQRGRPAVPEAPPTRTKAKAAPPFSNPVSSGARRCRRLPVPRSPRAKMNTTETAPSLGRHRPMERTATPTPPRTARPP